MDLLYILHEKTHWGNHEELRYSIRSFQKNYPDLDRIFIVGHKPSWVKDVVHIPMKDEHKNNPEANIVSKIIRACLSDISDNFIFSADDYYIRKPVDDLALSEVINHGSYKNYKYTGPHKFSSALDNTIKLLHTKGANTFINCEAHCPVVINKHDYLRIMSDVHYSVKPGINPFTYYFNMVSGSRFVLSKATGYLNKHQSEEEVQSELENKRYFTVTTNIFGATISKYISELFSAPSGYEKRTLSRQIIDYINGMPGTYSNEALVKSIKVVADDQRHKSETAIVCCYFNPQNYAAPLENYLAFRKALGSINLITVELSFNGQFDIPDAIQISGNKRKNLMWQKERLLNIGIQAVPAHIKYIGWMDADMVFMNNDWLVNAICLLDHSPMVQLYWQIRYMDKYGVKSSSKLAYCFAVKEDNSHGNPGGGWLTTAEYARKFGLFDKAIIGGGDTHNVYGLFQQKRYYRGGYADTPSFREEVEKWASPQREMWTGKTLPVISNQLIHLFHGSQKNRNYASRHDILTKNLFDPQKDIRINEDGIWEWATGKFRMHKAVAEHFEKRKEDE